jgi:hypothetical protein
MARPAAARATLLKLAGEPRVCGPDLLMTHEALRASYLLHFEGNPGAPAHDGPERLLIKTLNGDVATDDRIVMVNDGLVHNELCGLLQDADCFVSLHRSEGFGRRSHVAGHALHRHRLVRQAAPPSSVRRRLSRVLHVAHAR